jgi:hypothetical protein
MCTRAKPGFCQSIECLNLHASRSLSPISKSYKTALLDPNWVAAMKEEFHVLLENNTWQVVPRPPSANCVWQMGPSPKIALQW